jgi:hypothetical protein
MRALGKSGLLPLGLLTSIVALGPALGCGGSSARADAAGGTGGGRDGAAGAGGTGGAAATVDDGCDPEPRLDAASPICNAVPNGAPSVAFTADPGSPPSFIGGAVQDGLYYVTAVDGYGSAIPAGRRLTLAITGGGTQLFWNGETLDGTAQDIEQTYAANATASVSGSTLTLTTTCASVSPSPLPASVSFTATATTLALASVISASNVSVVTYTRQGCFVGSEP